MKLSEIKQHLKIYQHIIRFSIIDALNYKTNFLVGIIVDVSYQVVLIAFFYILFGNINSLAGWNYYEVMILVGISIISDQFLLAFSYVFNLFRLAYKINRGEIDFILLKPVNSLFYATFGHLYIAGFIGAASGIFLVINGLINLNIQITPLQVIFTVITFVSGLIISYCLVTIFTSLSFRFINDDVLTRMGQSLLNFANKPDSIFNVNLQRFFTLIIPIIFVASIPTRILTRGFSWQLSLASIVVAVIFLLLTTKIWNYQLKFYSSASS